MKRTIKLISVVLAGLALASCVKEELTVLHPDQFKAGQLAEISSSYTLSSDQADETMATFTFDKTDYGLSAAVQYALYADINSDFSKEKKLGSASTAENGISVSVKNVNNLLIGYGCPADQAVTVYFRLKSNMMGEKNIIDGTEIISNTVSSSITPYVAAKEYAKVWALGSFNSWKHETAQYLYNYAEDDVTYKGVIDFGESHADNQFKFTGAASWDNETGNWGVSDASTPAESDEIQLLNASNDNITQYTAKRFYLFSLNKNTLVLSKLASFDQIGIVGSINDWGNDVVMEYNSYKGRFWADLNLPAGAEIKFRADAGWDTNWGSKDGATVAKGADNIVVADGGDYRVYLNLGEGTFALDASMYGKDEPTASEEPEEPEPAYQGWGIIGVGGDWENDIAMTESDGVWTGFANLTAEDSWKLRKDAAWDENAGGTFTALGTAFDAVSGGPDIKVGTAGFFKIVYDTKAGKITVYEGTVWSLIGEFNEWSGDSDMTEVDGKWVSGEVALKGEWKIRKNHAWDDDRGGAFEALGTAFAVTKGGANINCGEGTFIVTYDPAAETITVVNAKKVWGLIGVADDWNNDIAMTEVMPGIWMSPKTALSKTWKVRFDHGWDLNYGGTTPTKAGQFVQAVKNGDNIALEGEYTVVLNTNAGIISTLGWGVTGSIASTGINWDGDIPMTLGADGKWYSVPFALTTADEIKLREFGGWDANRGGTCAAAGEAFAVTNNGANIKAPADGTYMVIYDPAAETITLDQKYWGLIGEFNGWAGDDFMVPGGDGKWYAFDRNYQKGWKLRQNAGWDVNRGGTYVFNDPFAVTNNGDNIVVEEGVANAGFGIIYDSAAETVTVNQNIVF